MSEVPESEKLTPFGAEPEKSRTGLYITVVLVAIWYLFLAAMVIDAVRSR